jgi:hypothetical protein
MPAVRTLSSLLAVPDLPVLRPITCPDGDVEVFGVTIVEDLADLDRLEEKAIAVLTHGASRDASSYNLDIALRMAGSRDAAAIVLTDDREGVPPTAVPIAERARLAILCTAADCDVTALVLGLHRELAGGADVALARIQSALWALAKAGSDGASPNQLIATASEGLEVDLELRDARPGDIAAPVIVEDDLVASVCARPVNDHTDAAAEAIVHLVAAAVTRARLVALRAEDAPIRSRGELLTEFLLAPGHRGDHLLERMRAADLAVDGWHTAILLEVDNLDALADDELSLLNLSDRVARLGLEAAQASGGIWRRAQIGSALLLIRMERTDSTPAGRDLARIAGQIVRRVVGRIPEIALTCGVGSTHVGANGLRTTVAEARGALAAARAGHRVNEPVSFDELGLQRTLMEWFASETARDAVDSLLRPIDELGPRKSQAAMQTLQCFLDNHGSATRAAKHLHLHRNAVTYRVNRIFQMLDVDPDDPETWLMLQLACRARSLG